MNTQLLDESAKKAFDKQSIVFDDIYAENSIIHYKRYRTRTHLERYLKAGSTILELNAGTGQDAIYFAQKGYTIHATDISEGMLQQLNQKVAKLNLSDSITSEKISFMDLENINSSKSFDAIFSNFGGLNCTDRLDNVLDSFRSLLNPDGIVTLIIMPSFCLWEFLMIFKLDFKKAFRRFFAKKGAKAQIDGVKFRCWYYQPSYIVKHLKKDFELINLEGLCTIVPPSYLENFPIKCPKLWRLLMREENKLKNSFPFKYIGDYFIITLKKI